MEQLKKNKFYCCVKKEILAIDHGMGSTNQHLPDVIVHIWDLKSAHQLFPRWQAPYTSISPFDIKWSSRTLNLTSLQPNGGQKIEMREKEKIDGQEDWKSEADEEKMAVGGSGDAASCSKILIMRTCVRCRDIKDGSLQTHQ